jgi:iron complex transport system permease protein
MNKKPVLLAIGLAAVIVSAILCTGAGAIDISGWEILKAVGQAFSSTLNNNESGHYTIVMDVRLPRIVLSFIAGAALGAVGTSMQAVFRNPMADPYVLGVSSGASVGAAIAIVCGMSYAVGVGAMAFLGAATVAALLFSVGLWHRRFDQKTMLLTGIALQMVCVAVVSLLISLNRNNIESIVFWTMGSFNAASWPTVLLTAIPVGVGIAWLMSMASKLNILSMGNETAHSLGINIKRSVLTILGISAMMVAFVVANSGVIGFVGLVVPHLGRMALGPDNRYLLPFAALLGGWLTMVCDTLARTIIAPSELPVGTVTAFIGAPYFLWMILKSKNTLQ